ncbi:MAG: YlbF family regulator [Halanaerobiaceae bacterium]
MSIQEKAKSLGEAIKDSPEYKVLRSSEAAMYNDEDAKVILDDFNALQKRVQMAQQNGKQITQQQQRQMQNLRSKMQNNDKVKEFMEAQQEFNEIMKSVNETITGVLGDNNPEN